jgi:hypothetical protein
VLGECKLRAEQLLPREYTINKGKDLLGINFVRNGFYIKLPGISGHVESMGEKRNAYRVLLGKSEGKRPLGKSIRTYRIILKYNLEKEDWVLWTRFIWLRIETSGGIF